MDESTLSPARGQTHYNGRTIDTNNYGQSVALEGVLGEFPNTNPTLSGGIRVRRNGGKVYARLVRNVSGTTLYPGRAVCFASGYEGRRVDRYARVTAEAVAGVVDDHYSSAGIPNGDLFWIIYKGQVLHKTPSDGDGLQFAVGDHLYALTAVVAAATASTTGGRPKPWTSFTFTAAQTTDGSGGKIIANRYAICLSAKTTNNTEADMLVEMINLGNPID